MKWASTIAIGKELKAAIDENSTTIIKQLGPGHDPTIVAIFLSASYSSEYVKATKIIRAHFPNSTIIGCSAQSVIGNAIEEENNKAISITAGYLPNVSINSFRITQENLPTPDDSPDEWIKLIGVNPNDNNGFIILMDPFTASGDAILAGLDFAYPGVTKVGGIASGGYSPGMNTLFLNDKTYSDGVVGLTFSGEIEIDSIVAQGCRPLGKTKRITKSHNNLLLEIDGEPPIIYLKSLYESLSPDDQQLVKGSLFIGMAIDATLEADELKLGDFLIRNIVGVDQEKQILAVNQILHEGQIVQFHVRDAQSSDKDLGNQLYDYIKSHGEDSTMGALLFQCNGRGFNMYRQSNHDSGQFKQHLKSTALGGFFCGGEIGQVGDFTYIHGFTSAIALFRVPS